MKHWMKYRYGVRNRMDRWVEDANPYLHFILSPGAKKYIQKINRISIKRLPANTISVSLGRCSLKRRKIETGNTHQVPSFYRLILIFTFTFTVAFAQTSATVHHHLPGKAIITPPRVLVPAAAAPHISPSWSRDGILFDALVTSLLLCRPRDNLN